MTYVAIDRGSEPAAMRALDRLHLPLLGAALLAVVAVLLVSLERSGPDLQSLGGEVRAIDGPLELRSQPATVALGDGTVLVWGGRSVSTDSGNVFDPATRTWERLPAAPGPPRFGAASTWTGTEAVIWGGSTRNPIALDSAGIAWNPSTGQWRELPAAPVALLHARAAALGGGMLVAGAERALSSPVSLWHDLATGEWSIVPVPFTVISMTVEGDRLIATGPQPPTAVETFGPPGSATSGRPPWLVMAFDPAARLWAEVAPPLHDVEWAAVAPTTDGSLTAVIAGLNQPLRGLVLEDGAWREVAATRDASGWLTTIEIRGYPPSATWTGGQLIVGGSGGIAAWDPDQRRFAGRTDPAIKTFGAEAVWTGEHLVSLTNQVSEGWIWTPAG